MVIGIGTDIIEIKRIEEAVKEFKLYEKMFHSQRTRTL